MMEYRGMKRVVPALEDQLQLATVRCLSILRRYHYGEQTSRAKEMMAAEVELVIGYLLELDLPHGATQGGVLAPVAEYLGLRHGPEAGTRLNAEFVAIFESVGMTLLAPMVTPRALADGQAGPPCGPFAAPNGHLADGDGRAHAPTGIVARRD